MMLKALLAVLNLAAIATTAIGLVTSSANTGQKRGSEPVIREVKPPSAAVGERVKIEGENFGDGAPVVTFNGVAAAIVKAEDDEVRVIVPPRATTGPLVVSVGGRASKPVPFVVRGSAVRRTAPPQSPPPADSSEAGRPSGASPVSFARDIQPIFDRSCTDCHGGSAGMFLDEGESYVNLVNVPATKGCTSEMRVQPGNPDASVLYKRITGTSCGAQMPKKAPPLPAEEIALIRRWIESGAPNN
jgi:hypothetical protein